MKILFFASTYPHPSYPFSAFIKLICEEMTRQGHEVTVIAPQSMTSTLLGRKKKIPNDVLYDVSCEEGVKHIKVLRPYSLTFGRFHRATWKAKKCVVYKTLKKMSIDSDVLYAHFWNNAYNALEISKKTGKPLFVATGEDKIVADEVLNANEIEALRNCVKGVICVSTKNKVESINKGLTVEEKCIVLPNATDHGLFYKKDKLKCREMLGFPKDAFIVAFSGRFIERKGVNRVSHAISLCKDSRIKSIFIGQTTGDNVIRPNCDGILFEGPLDHIQMPDYLNAADVFVLPSIAEGCSNSIIEAMACGLPIISSALPFNEDICNENNSILVDPMDVQAIANAIKKMMNVEFAKMLSEGAIKTAAGLNISERTSKILSFIEQNR
jgi:glycosyltransferase involved in cell wall biosynthesis